MREKNLHDWLTLSLLPGIGCIQTHRLLEAFGSPAAVLNAGQDALRNVPGIGVKLASKIASPGELDKARAAAAGELNKAARLQISIIPFDNDHYPASLKNIPDPPVLLYCRGKVEYLGRPGVAVVGSRSATVYGKRISHALGRDLAKNGIPVISGLAYGIDGEAHAGALEAEGITIAVLGCGVDVIYPAQNSSLFAQIAKNGLLVSEYPLGTPPEAFRFPKRNRIISGLSLGVVVVEATVKSGSLITAGLALDQGREVFAVPGRVDSPKSMGAHRLLQQGARLVHNAADILDELHLSSMLHLDVPGVSPAADDGGMSEEEQHLFSCLDTYPINIDELALLSGYDAGMLADLLVRLELRGMVRQLPGQQYELCMQ